MGAGLQSGSERLARVSRLLVGDTIGFRVFPKGFSRLAELFGWEYLGSFCSRGFQDAWFGAQSEAVKDVPTPMELPPARPRCGVPLKPTLGQAKRSEADQIFKPMQEDYKFDLEPCFRTYLLRLNIQGDRTLKRHWPECADLFLYFLSGKPSLV